MRILQLIETGGPGGAETVFARLVEALTSQGHDVHAIVPSDDWLAARLRTVNCEFTVCESRGTLDLRFIKQIRSTVRELGIDVVHSHLFGSTVYATMGTLGTGVPVVGTLHGHADLKQGGMRMGVKRFLVRHGCTRMTAVSESLAQYAVQVLKYPRSGMRVVHNGVDVAQSGHPLDTQPRNPSRGSREERSVRWPTIGTVGNIRSSKDYPNLLYAFAKILDRFPTASLEIAGAADKSGLVEALQAQARAMGLAERVNFRGFIEDPTAFLTSLDVFVLSSSNEGFSLATVEAMLAGVPVVATRCGGPEEIIHHGTTGLLVPPSDPSALADAIAHTLADPNATDLRTNAAQIEGLQRFTLDSMVNAYTRIYEEVIRR